MHLIRGEQPGGSCGSPKRARLRHDARGMVDWNVAVDPTFSPPQSHVRVSAEGHAYDVDVIGHAILAWLDAFWGNVNGGNMTVRAAAFDSACEHELWGLVVQDVECFWRENPTLCKIIENSEI